jgi:hypothetical protein
MVDTFAHLSRISAPRAADKARGFAIIRRGRRPNPLNTAFPFREVSFLGATPGRMTTTQG